MIKLMLGNIGSGKTACQVRELVLNPSNRVTFSNIITDKIPNNVVINPDMIIKKELIHTKRSGEKVYKYHLNKDFWKEAHDKHKGINVIIDEAHTVVDSRRAMSKVNRVMSDYMALLRRVIGTDEQGNLTLISQIARRIDVNARELATKIHYHVCHYVKTCRACGSRYQEHNEMPEKVIRCRKCQTSNLIKSNHVIEVWHFQDYETYYYWYKFGTKSYHSHYYIKDIEKYFPYYNTLQWDNLISEL